MKRRISILIAALAVAAFGALMTASTAEALGTVTGIFTGEFLIYVNVEGVDGGSTNTIGGHNGWIQAKGFVHALGRNTGEPVVSGTAIRTASVPVAAPFVITKNMDMASPLLHKLSINKQLIRRVTIDLVAKRSDGSWVPLMQYRLRDVLINSVSASSVTTVAGDETPPTEEVSFSFRSIEWDYVYGGVQTQAGFEVAR